MSWQRAQLLGAVAWTNAGPSARRKVREEGDELARALCDEPNARVVSEAADVTYRMLAGLLSRGLSLRDLEVELARRFGMSGLEEKASRPPK